MNQDRMDVETKWHVTFCAELQKADGSTLAVYTCNDCCALLAVEAIRVHAVSQHGGLHRLFGCHC